MPLIAFDKKLKLSKANLAKLERINQVISRYQAMGYKLTLRQLYYQLVTQNVIPNNDKEYSKLSVLLTKGRMAGYIDWEAIEDRTRVPRRVYVTNGVAAALDDAEATYIRDRMAGQKNYVELWVEKDALSNVLSRKTNHYTIRLMVNRGYSSTTAMKDSYDRIKQELSEGRNVHILYLGDHDPSGLDMVRDIYDRLFYMLAQRTTKKILALAAEEDANDTLYNKWNMDERVADDEGTYYPHRAYILEHFEIRHIGLTSEQVRQYNPPPNPAKLTDPRAGWYISQFGHTSWEVDALDPVTLHEIIDTNIDTLVDMNLFNQQIAQEQADKAELKALPQVKETLNTTVKDNRELRVKLLATSADEAAKERKIQVAKEFLLGGSKSQSPKVIKKVITDVLEILNR